MAGFDEMLALWFRMMLTPAMREAVPKYDPKVNWEECVKAVYAEVGMPIDELLEGEIKDLSVFKNIPMYIPDRVIVTANTAFDEELDPSLPAKYAEKPGARTLLLLLICSVLQEDRAWSKDFRMVGFDINLLCLEFKQEGSDGWYEMYCLALLAVLENNRLNEWLKKTPCMLINDVDEDFIGLWGEENKEALNERMVWLMDDICPPNDVV